ncbi:uncharacterized protein DUF2591 [Orbus hercynius]|uniref:Uncharacterized protein DUF2591 n=1 Tax=Orbus hercynius TaxID=593135 RepID=A0A495RJE6_9GAMM|nr:phage protein NinX family protein [Orbus hercynius]RKS87286.1 uncharacterized protein DUF2591 [Orbus hercynius]
MENKYSGLSDFEVNKLVAEKLGYKYSCDDTQGAVLVESISSGYGGFKTIILSKNYCFDYSEVFKLMIDNKLDLDFNPLTNSWSCRKRTNKKYISSLNENPCRAIAECFLLIKDEENKDDK